MTNEKQKKTDADNIASSASTVLNSNQVELYSEVQSEYIKSYTGVDKITGQILTKSLKSISQEKINPNYVKQNTLQKAGFAAEVKSVARQNEDAILSGSTKRVIRTDDFGRVNEQYADTTVVDSLGNEIFGKQTQIKFVGATAKDTHAKLMSKAYEKYFENPGKVQKIEIASDKFDDVLNISKNKVEEYQKQLNSPHVQINAKLAESIKDKINKEQKLQEMLKKSSVSTNEAIFAVNNPILSTVGDVARVSHNAGIDRIKSTASIGALIQGGMAFYQVMTGEITAEEGFNNFTIGTAKIAANGYIVGSTATLMKTALKESTHSVLKSVGTGNFPVIIAKSIISSTDTLHDFFSGDITAMECAQRLGASGTSTVLGTAYATAGAALIPIPIAGAIIGGFVGTILGAACHNALKAALAEKNIAIERRKQIEKECDEYDRWLDEQRRILNAISEKYLTEHREVFNNALQDIRGGLVNYDADKVVEGANKITKKLGGKTQFDNFKEFDSFMESDKDFIL